MKTDLIKKKCSEVTSTSSVELCVYKTVEEMGKNVDVCTSLPDFSSSSLSLLLMKQS